MKTLLSKISNRVSRASLTKPGIISIPMAQNKGESLSHTLMMMTMNDDDDNDDENDDENDKNVKK